MFGCGQIPILLNGLTMLLYHHLFPKYFSMGRLWGFLGDGESGCNAFKINELNKSHPQMGRN